MPLVTPVEADVQRIFLPSTKELPEDQRLWVDFDVSPATVANLLSVDSRDTAGESAVKRVFERLKDWNFFADEAETIKYPINLENMPLIKLDDFTFLQKQIRTESGELDSAEKKASRSI